MDNNYLAWYKDIEIEITNRDDINLLMASSVSQPTELLLADLKKFSRQVEKRIPYSNAYGHPLFIDAIAARYNLDPERIVITNGVSNAIYLVCKAVLEKGDHVLVETPVYQALTMAPMDIGTDITFYDRSAEAGKLDIECLVSLVRPSTKMIMLTNIHNPTGVFITDDTIKELAIAAKKINPEIVIFIDEIYRDFMPGDLSCSYNLDDNIISLNSLTKVYGLGIIHHGWLVANEKITSKVKFIQNFVEGSGSRLLESFSSLVMENLESYRKQALVTLKDNTEIMSQYIQPLIDKEIISGDPPRYGCVYFPKVNGVDNTDTLVQKLIDRYKIYLVPGSFFRAPSHIRIGFGGDTAGLKQSLGRFTEALQEIF